MNIKNRKSFALPDETQHDGEKSVQKLKDELDKIRLDKEVERQQKLELEKLNKDLLSQQSRDIVNDVKEKELKDALAEKEKELNDALAEKEKQLNDALTEKEKELEQLKNDLNQKVSTINQLESDLSNSKQEIINEKSELEKIKIELQDQKSCVENLTKELSINKQEAQDSVNKYQSESRVALEVNKHEINELKAQKDQLLSNIQQLNNDLTSSKSETEKYMKSNQSIQEELDNVKSRLKSINEESEKIIKENSDKVVLINQLKSDLIKESDLLKKHLEEREKQNTDYEKLLDQLNLTKEEYENKINQLTSDLIKSQEEVEIAKTENSVDKSVQDRLKNIQQENDLLIFQIKKLNDDLSNRDSTLNLANLELQSVTDQRNEALRELENVKSELGSAVHNIHNIKNDLDNQSNAIKDLRLKLESKENTIQQQKNSLSNMVPKEQYNSLSENLAQFKSEFQSVENLKSELASTKAELKAAKDAEDWIKKRNNTLTQKLVSLEVSLERLLFNLLYSFFSTPSPYLEQLKQLENNNSMLQKQVAELSPKARSVDKLIKAHELEKKCKELGSTSTSPISPASPTSPTSITSRSPKFSSKSLAMTNGDASNDVTSTSNVVEPQNTKQKRKSAIEPLQSYTIESNEINSSNNQPVPRPKKDTDEGWITVKKRNSKRNSTVIDHN
ncbi:8243_t:CDS:2 [Rhizophagus irregularis]|nr:8243_t:CDS:2 [Rhizophagus irregularis]